MIEPKRSEIHEIRKMSPTEQFDYLNSRIKAASMTISRYNSNGDKESKLAQWKLIVSTMNNVWEPVQAVTIVEIRLDELIAERVKTLMEKGMLYMIAKSRLNWDPSFAQNVTQPDNFEVQITRDKLLLFQKAVALAYGFSFSG